MQTIFRAANYQKFELILIKICHGHGCAEIKGNIGKKRENFTGFENAITFFKITTECSEN
jgi:hypothetical protein